MSSSMLLMKDRAAWAVASAPKRIPAPSCMGAIFGARFMVITLAAHLPASRLNVSPTAIGLKPPHFFSSDMRFAPKSSGWTLTGISLLRRMLHSSVIESRNFWPVSPSLTEIA